jgi:hypothetical protein
MKHKNNGELSVTLHYSSLKRVTNKHSKIDQDQMTNSKQTRKTSYHRHWINRKSGNITSKYVLLELNRLTVCSTNDQVWHREIENMINLISISNIEIMTEFHMRIPGPGGFTDFYWNLKKM